MALLIVGAWIVLLCQTKGRETWLTKSTLVVTEAVLSQPGNIASTAKGFGIPISISPHEAALPELVLTGQEANRVKGEQAIYGFLQGLERRNAAEQGGRTMLTVLLVAVILASLISQHFWWFAQTGPLLLLVAATGLGTPCLTCAANVSTLSGLAGPAMLVVAILASWCFWSRKGAQSEWPWQALFGLAVAMELTQLYLILHEPKFCVFCATGGVGLLMIAWCSLKTLATRTSAMVVIPKVAYRFFSAVSIAGLATQSLVAGGSDLRYRLTPPQTELPNPIGQPLRNYVASFQAKEATPVLVTRPWCPACKRAKADLAKAHVNYVEIEPCTPLNGQPCFDGGDSSYGLPMVMFVTERGTVSLYQEGWATSEKGTVSLLEDLKKLINKSTQRR